MLSHCDLSDVCVTRFVDTDIPPRSIHTLPFEVSKRRRLSDNVLPHPHPVPHLPHRLFRPSYGAFRFDTDTLLVGDRRRRRIGTGCYSRIIVHRGISDACHVVRWRTQGTSPSTEQEIYGEKGRRHS